MNNKSQNNREVYSTSNFSELLASPFFFYVLILAVILGLASIFGFFENPRKLKFIIDLISQRVSISKVDQKLEPKLVQLKAQVQVSIEAPEIVKNNTVLMAQKELQLVSKKDGSITVSSLNKDRYAIFSEDFSLLDSNVMPMPKDTTVSVAIDYNISSSTFWGDLGLSDAISGRIMGAPISPYYNLENAPFKYDLRVSHFIL